MSDHPHEHRTEEEVLSEQQGVAAMSDHEHTEPEPDEREAPREEPAEEGGDEDPGGDAEERSA